MVRSGAWLRGQQVSIAEQSTVQWTGAVWHAASSALPSSAPLQPCMTLTGKRDWGRGDVGVGNRLDVTQRDLGSLQTAGIGWEWVSIGLTIYWCRCGDGLQVAQSNLLGSLQAGQAGVR